MEKTKRGITKGKTSGKASSNKDRQMTFIFPVRVTSVFERKLQKHVSGVGKDAVFTSESSGWYIRLNDEVSLYLGKEQPAIDPADEFELVLRKRSRK